MSKRRELEELVARAGSRGHDGLAVGVLADGRSGFAGSADETAIFEIGSLTKPFTGVLLAEMCERGEVRLVGAGRRVESLRGEY